MTDKTVAWMARSAVVAAVAAALVQGAVAETVFKAEFREGLPGWKVENGNTVVAVEKTFGEAALVVRRDPMAKSKGTNWGVTSGQFAVVPGRRLSIIVRARSTYEDLRFCHGFFGKYITGVNWFDGNGRNISIPYGFGYDLKKGDWCGEYYIRLYKQILADMDPPGLNEI